MCGINGIFAYHYAANPIDRAELLRTRDHMATRGPDGAGRWVSEVGRIGLGHRRLSIIDLSDAGAQPMKSADEALVITFNGEIYNYRALRQALEAKGHAFRSQSDTEVLLHLYAERGASMVDDLRGMFAFAIWDRARHSLFLARDPYGIKPLYYADDGSTFRFASQVKALLAGGAVSRDPEPAGLVGFYLFGSVPEPYTTYRDIRTLKAGSTLTVGQVGAHEPQRYFSIAQVYCNAEAQAQRRGAITEAECQAEIRAALLDSVRHHLVADVPVGAFLSAGVDSGALVGLMRDAGQQDIQTVTLAFEEFRGRDQDEAPLAEEVARLYGARHTTRVVTESEFTTDLPRILDAMDQPSIDGINTWFVSKAAHELGLKVSISGLGGDELFGGYPSFRDLPRWVNWLSWPANLPGLGVLSRRILSKANLQSLGASPKLAGMLELGGDFSGAYLLRRGLFMPWELDQVLEPEFAAAGLRLLAPNALIGAELVPEPRSSFAKVAALEAGLYMRNQLLRDADWASMAHELEVRLPLVDSTLLAQTAQTCAAHSTNEGKMLLAKAPNVPLMTLSGRPKTGFDTPVGTWLQRDDRLQCWRKKPALMGKGCHWSRRWAFQIEASQACVT